MSISEKNMEFLFQLGILAENNNKINPELYNKYNVKRGLRNQDGSGVLVGLTTIGDVHGYIIDEGEASPVEGRLRYRGYDVKDLVAAFQKEKRFGFEEIIFLLLFGKLPNQEELEMFKAILVECRELPKDFKENIIMRYPSKDLMNMLAKSVLALYAYDDNSDLVNIPNVLMQSINLIAKFPVIAAYSYQSKLHYFNNKSLTIHNQTSIYSTAENFLSLIRPNQEFTPLEAEILDLALVLHAEHGGGNNSSFTVHVVSSTDTDTYSAIASGICSLKGPKHGGANYLVMEMMEDIKNNVADINNEHEIKDYIRKILRKQAFDRSGLIYGMGHAVYSLSDPRAELLKEKAGLLASEKGRVDEYNLYCSVEKFGKQIFEEEKKSKIICANVDFYSGFVYNMLGIDNELHTPLFAIARVPGWSAHRIEELVSGARIMRPAYKYIQEENDYIPLEKR